MEKRQILRAKIKAIFVQQDRLDEFIANHGDLYAHSSQQPLDLIEAVAEWSGLDAKRKALSKALRFLDGAGE
jgi:hypothetical protein